MLIAKGGTGSAKARHHLIQNQDQTKFIAQRPYFGPVIIRRHDRPAGGARYGLSNKPSDGPRAFRQDHIPHLIHIILTERNGIHTTRRT